MGLIPKKKTYRMEYYEYGEAPKPKRKNCPARCKGGKEPRNSNKTCGRCRGKGYIEE